MIETKRRFEVTETSLTGLKVVVRKPLTDDRGFFERVYCANDLSELGIEKIVQVNHSNTARKGTVRGLHYQRPPHAEIKYVSCLRGAIFDVAVDIRRGSDTFLRWHGETLSEENHRTLAIPEGFAHGFQTLTDDCELLYLVSTEYEPAAESGINHADPLLGIIWPEAITQLSSRDEAIPYLPSDFAGVRF